MSTPCVMFQHDASSAGEGVVVDVDRFDPGRPEKQGSRVVPTALIPGDIAIPCQVGHSAVSITVPPVIICSWDYRTMCDKQILITVPGRNVDHCPRKGFLSLSQEGILITALFPREP